MGDSNQQGEFRRFQPICLRLTKEHTVQNAISLYDALQMPVEPVVLQQMQEYLLFPLRFCQKQPKIKCENFQTEIIRCQSEVLSCTEVPRYEMFQDIFTSLCIGLSSSDPQQRVAPVCEELKLVSVQCLSALINSCSTSVLVRVYKPDFLPAMGHAISLLLHMVGTEAMRDLRVASMYCLQHLCALNRKLINKQREMIADMFASFLPGVSMAMSKVATGDVKQGHLITKVAIETWHKVVTMVIGDDNLTGDTTNTTQPDPEKAYEKLIVTRSPEWVTMTTEKLKILVTKMVPLCNHGNWRVRLAIVEWADMLLRKSTKSLECCVSELLSVLVSCVGDDYEKVSTASKNALTTFQHNVTNSKPLVEILEDNLHSLATSMPRLMRTADDDTKHAHLCLFNGYLRLLGPRTNELLRSYSHLRHVSLALLQVLELESAGLSIIQEKTPDVPLHEREGVQDAVWMRKAFKHFTDDKILQDLLQLIHMLSCHADLDLLVDHFLEKFMQSSLHRKQAAFILNEILVGCCGHGSTVDVPITSYREKESLVNIVRTITEEYLQPEYLNLVTSNQSEEGIQVPTKGPDWQIVSASQSLGKRSGLTVEQINSNILQICLMLEGLAKGAKVLGKDYEPLLMDVLYPVLDKLGDDNATVSRTAYTALWHITQACQYSSIPELLHVNADYLVNSISLRLRHLASHPRAPLVLKVTLTYSDKDILPLVEDTVTEVMQSLDNHYGDRAVTFLRVLHTLVLSIAKWFSTSVAKNTVSNNREPADNLVETLIQKQQESLPDDRGNHSLEDIEDYFLDYLKQKRIAASFEDDEINEEVTGDELKTKEEEAADYETDQKKPPPTHVTITMEVLQRCIHLLASPSPRLRLLVLDTVAGCCLVLQQHQDQLLPLVHKLWPPFVMRFMDEEQLVIIKAFHILSVIGDTSGDFIRQRVVKDVIPKLTSQLHKLSIASVKAGPAYRFTVACRLQLSILEGLGSLCDRVGLGENQLLPVLKATVSYLSCRQHTVLQEAAVDAWMRFAAQEADCVWLMLNKMYCPHPPSPPHDCFKPVQFGPDASKRNEFSDNIIKILDVL